MRDRLRALLSLWKDEAICSFCGSDVDLGAPGGLSIGVGSIRDECVQGLFAHAVCVERRLDPRVETDESFEADRSEGICAFCGSDLKLEAPGVLWMTLGSRRDESRELLTHAACIEQRLIPDVMFDGSDFEPDDSD
jgi:hypothetical protein